MPTKGRRIRISSLHRLLFPLVLCSSASLLRADLLITTDTFWTSTPAVRVLPETVRIRNGAKLTLESGLILKPQFPFVRIIVENGALDARGVIITSYKDDGHGGDTNGDGNATRPAPGDWGAVQFESGADNARTVVQSSELWYGGSGESQMVIRNNGSLRIENSRFFHSFSDGLHIQGAGAAPVIDGCAVQFNPRGIRISGQARPTVQNCVVRQNVFGITGHDSDMGPAVIRNNVVQGNTEWAMALEASALEVSGNDIISNRQGIYFNGQGRPVLRGNRFGGNNGPVVYLENPNVFPQEMDSNVAVSTGALDGVELAGVRPGTVSGTWDSARWPYVIRQREVVIEVGARLTINPGAVVKFFDDAAGFLRIRGELIAEGTDQSPVVFTSLRDDRFGGDTNRFEGAVLPAAGDWRKVVLEGSSQVRNAVFRYGGRNNSGQLTVSGPGPVSVRSALIENSSNYGIETDGPNAAPLIDGCTVQANSRGIRISGRSSPTVQNCVIRRNAFGISGHDSDMGPAVIRNNAVQDNTEWAIALEARVPEVSGNSIFSNLQGIYLNGQGRPVIRGNRFGGNNGAVVYLENPNVFPQEMDSNVAVSTGALDGIELAGVRPGTMSGTWDSARWPYVIRQREVVIDTGARLTLRPGVVVKLFNDSRGALRARGELIAEGTDERPVIFTSLRDDEFGGDTNRFEGAVSPSAGDWRGVLVEDSSSRFINGVFRFGGRNNSGMLDVMAGLPSGIHRCLFEFSVNYGVRANGPGTAVAISSSTFRTNRIGVFAVNNPDLSIAMSTFTRNTGHAVLNDGARIVNARLNGWGHPSGPLDDSDDRAGGGWYNPTGRGDRVSDRVDYNAWTGGEDLRLSSPTIRIREGSLVSIATVTLDLSVLGPATQMILSESPLFTGASYESFVSSRRWTLSAGDGPKTVYVRFRSAGGETSEVASDRTNLQTTPPQAVIDLTPPSPLSVGTSSVTLTSSEPLQRTPSLSYRPQGQEAIPVTLVARSSESFLGTIVIASQTPEGQALFSFSGVDGGGSTGTVIVRGGAFHVDRTAPLPPGLNAPLSLPEGRIRLSWAPPSGEPFLRYQIYRSTEPIVSTSTVIPLRTDLQQTQYEDTPPGDGIYHYAVKARDEARNVSAYSNSRSATADRNAPSPITTLAGEFRYRDQFLLSWQIPPGERPALYRLYRALNSTPTASPGHLIHATTDFAYVDRPARNGFYYYGLTALDEVGNESSLVQTVQADVDLSSTAVRSLQLTPPPPVRRGPLNVLVRLSRSMETFVPLDVDLWTNGSPSPIRLSSTSYANDVWTGAVLITTRVAEGPAWLAIHGGRDPWGEPVVSSSQSFLIDYTPPLPPANVNALPAGNGSEVRLSWNPGEPGLIFSVFRSTDRFMSGGSNPIVSGLTQPTFSDAPVAISSQVAYAVKAIDPAGNESAMSSQAMVSSPLMPLLSSPPHGARLSSLAVRFHGMAQRGTSVHVFNSTGVFIGSGTVIGDRTFSFEAVFPQAGEHLLYAVAADQDGRTSSPTGSLRIEIVLPPGQASRPALEPGDALMTLRWSPNPEPDIRGYWIYRDGASAPLNAVPVTPSESLRFIDTGLTNGRRYGYQINAENRAGLTGQKSIVVEAEPAAGPGWGGTP